MCLQGSESQSQCQNCDTVGSTAVLTHGSLYSTSIEYHSSMGKRRHFAWGFGGDRQVWCAGGAPHPALWYLGIYAGVSAAQIVFQLSSTLLLKILSLAAARTMHNNMLKALLRWVAPMPALVHQADLQAEAASTQDGAAPDTAPSQREPAAYLGAAFDLGCPFLPVCRTMHDLLGRAKAGQAKPPIGPSKDAL